LTALIKCFFFRFLFVRIVDFSVEIWKTNKQTTIVYRDAGKIANSKLIIHNIARNRFSYENEKRLLGQRYLE
jgi:hypothetical protein